MIHPVKIITTVADQNFADHASRIRFDVDRANLVSEPREQVDSTRLEKVSIK